MADRIVPIKDTAKKKRYKHAFDTPWHSPQTQTAPQSMGLLILTTQMVENIENEGAHSKHSDVYFPIHWELDDLIHRRRSLDDGLWAEPSRQLLPRPEAGARLRPKDASHQRRHLDHRGCDEAQGQGGAERLNMSELRVQFSYQVVANRSAQLAGPPHQLTSPTCRVQYSHMRLDLEAEIGKRRALPAVVLWHMAFGFSKVESCAACLPMSSLAPPPPEKLLLSSVKPAEFPDDLGDLGGGCHGHHPHSCRTIILV